MTTQNEMTADERAVLAEAKAFADIYGTRSDMFGKASGLLADQRTIIDRLIASAERDAVRNAALEQAAKAIDGDEIIAGGKAEFRAGYAMAAKHFAKFIRRLKSPPPEQSP